MGALMDQSQTEVAAAVHGRKEASLVLSSV